MKAASPYRVDGRNSSVPPDRTRKPHQFSEDRMQHALRFSRSARSRQSAADEKTEKPLGRSRQSVASESEADGLLMHKISRSWSFVHRLGLPTAARAIWGFYGHRLGLADRAKPSRLGVPGSTRPVWLRPGTTDWHVYEQIFVRRDYDLSPLPQFANLQRRYQHILDSGKHPLIIDCGANTGLSTIWFKSAFPAATVHAIEPDGANFQMLKRNIAGCADISAERAGVWDRKAMLVVANPDDDEWSFQMTECNDASRRTKTPAVTIAEILRDRPDGEPFIVKIDIEGGERELFRSNTEWLDRVPLVIIELHDWQQPWNGLSNTFFSAASRRARDYVFRAENLFCFLH
jgi:FkbM family methyltransferase